MSRLTLGHSRHGYEEAVDDQQLETFLRLHERAFRDLGGVPLVIRHDSLRAGVTHASFDEPELNPTYQDFATHYGTAILPTRVARPATKRKWKRLCKWPSA